MPADRNREPAGEQAVPMPAHRATVELAAAAASTLRSRLALSKRPLALVGRGALLDGVPAAFNRFIDAWRMPFFTTYKAKGIADDRHALCAGSIGLSPVVDAESLRLIADADCLVLVCFDPIELRDA